MNKSPNDNQIYCIFCDNDSAQLGTLLRVKKKIQVQLFSGYWPLCGVAARTLFVQLVNVAEKQRLHGFLEFEMGMRAELLSMDLQVGPAVTSSKDNAPQTPPKKDVEDVEDCEVDCTDEIHRLWGPGLLRRCGLLRGRGRRR